MRLRGALLIVTVLALMPELVEAGRATCSNPGLPVGAVASSELMPGRLTLTITNQFLPIESSEVLAELTGMVRYDEQLVFNETRLAGEYAIRPWLAVGGALPYRVIDVDVVTRDPATGMVLPASDVHSRTETLSGIGDPSLLVHLAWDAGGFGFHARAGTTIPLGHTEEDPHFLGRIGERHQHLQLGSGTFVPFAGVEAQRAFALGSVRAVAAAWTTANFSVYDNDKGFRTGDRYSAGLNASSAFGLRRFTFGTALEGYAETAETWQGMVYTEEGNAGRFDLLAGGSVSWRPLDRFALIADARYPVYSRIEGQQLSYGLILGLGIAGTFDLAPRASWRGLDEAAAGPAGTAPDLVPVAGGITVFDLWAEWCAPCRDLDVRLAAIARANPGKLAVRKLDVIDPDSAAWARYMMPKGFDLPHIKVYAADGTLLFERSAPPAELARAVEDALR